MIVDFSFPEDVLIQVRINPKASNGYEIVTAIIIGNAPVLGAASFEKLYCGFLTYAIKDIISPIDVAGFYVVTCVAAEFNRESGWLTEDDIRMYCGGIVREASTDEINAIR